MAREKRTGNKDKAIYPCPVAHESLPRHIAIIMDGNGRWAKERGLRRSKGHEAGVETVRTIVEHCSDWGIGVLTLYAFSSENWSRPAIEVNALMRLLRGYLRKERDRLNDENVKILAIGDIDRLSSAARKELDLSIELTKNNTGLILQLALSYGARDEIVRAVKKIVAGGIDGRISADNITEDVISNNLDTAGVADPDLLVRTAGEMRLSNFLLWQASYAEYYSTMVCWPDFDGRELGKAVEEYNKRKRTYGRVEE